MCRFKIFFVSLSTSYFNDVAGPGSFSKLQATRRTPHLQIFDSSRPRWASKVFLHLTGMNYSAGRMNTCLFISLRRDYTVGMNEWV